MPLVRNAAHGALQTAHNGKKNADNQIQHEFILIASNCMFGIIFSYPFDSAITPKWNVRNNNSDKNKIEKNWVDDWLELNFSHKDHIDTIRRIRWSDTKTALFEWKLRSLVAIAANAAVVVNQCSPIHILDIRPRRNFRSKKIAFYIEFRTSDFDNLMYAHKYADAPRSQQNCESIFVFVTKFEQFHIHAGMKWHQNERARDAMIWYASQSIVKWWPIGKLQFPTKLCKSKSGNMYRINLLLVISHIFFKYVNK